METLEIFYEDLNELLRISILEFYNVNSPKDLNFDTQPIFILEKEDNESKDN